MARREYYAIFAGHDTGLYRTMEEVEKQIHDFPGAQFGIYSSFTAAVDAYSLFWRQKCRLEWEAKERQDAIQKSATRMTSVSDDVTVATLPEVVIDDDILARTSPTVVDDVVAIEQVVSESTLQVVPLPDEDTTSAGGFTEYWEYDYDDGFSFFEDVSEAEFCKWT